MIGEYGLDILEKKRKIFLCKPNLSRKTIAGLSESFQVNRKISRGNIGELSFKLPMNVFDKIKMKPIKNKHIDQIKERFLIRFEEENEIEYYIIDKITKNMDTSEYLTVNCYSLGYQLRDKTFDYDYTDNPKNLSQYMLDILSETNWNTGYVEASLDLKYRSMDLDGTVLELVQQIAEKFTALIVWDTVNKKINFYEAENFGVFKGMKVKQGKLMKDVQQEINLDEFCTRLKLYGKDGISIQEINPLGTDFIQDFSYFLYPFEMDNNGNILKSSDFFDDDLSIALVSYQKMIENNYNTYSDLLRELNNLDLQLSEKSNQLRSLQTEMIVLQDNLDTYNATHADNATNPNTNLINQISTKQGQINTKNSEISGINSQISAKKVQISNLNKLMSMENNFTKQQLIVLNDFIIVKELEDSNYTNARDLYVDGLKQFNKMREPKIVVSLSIVNFYEIISEQHNVGKLSIGDMILVEHDILGISTKAYVTEINFDYDAGDISITISNAQELLTDRERFIKEHQTNLSSSNKVDMKEYKWDRAVATVDGVSQILENEWDATKRTIAAGQNEDVSISRRGVIIKDPNDPLKMLIIQHGQLAITANGGNTWQTAINASGVFEHRACHNKIVGEVNA